MRTIAAHARSQQQQQHHHHHRGNDQYAKSPERIFNRSGEKTRCAALEEEKNRRKTAGIMKMRSEAVLVIWVSSVITALLETRGLK
ncbi:hypothetical protein INR49_018223 [Caranx melampygus]|nr:hypothetical protein INR49_018223 [Caranx melampygus]